MIYNTEILHVANYFGLAAVQTERLDGKRVEVGESHVSHGLICAGAQVICEPSERLLCDDDLVDCNMILRSVVLCEECLKAYLGRHSLAR